MVPSIVSKSEGHQGVMGREGLRRHGAAGDASGGLNTGRKPGQGRARGNAPGVAGIRRSAGSKTTECGKRQVRWPLRPRGATLYIDHCTPIVGVSRVAASHVAQSRESVGVFSLERRGWRRLC